MTTPKKRKFFVLDTNVPLHDGECLKNFKSGHVVIPITLIRELDKFKKEGGSLGYNARSFIRFLDESSADGLLNGGIKINRGRGLLSIKTERAPDPELEAKILWDKSVPDHRILNITFCLQKENPESTVVLVTKDTNLRMLTKAVGIRAEDYEKDKLIENKDFLYRGCLKVGEVSEVVLREMSKGVRPEALNLNEKSLVENQYLFFRRGDEEIASFYSRGVIKKVTPFSTFCIFPKNIEQIGALHSVTNKNISLVTITGKAGTGKTLIALAGALEQGDKYPGGILLARPIIPLSNRDIGYLPGDIESKIGPYMQPLYDNLDFIKSRLNGNKSKADELKRIENEKRLKIEPLAYIRGTTKNKVFMIIDEAQNLTPHEVKTIITRAGEGTKVVFTGDVHQVDHPYLDGESNGLVNLIEKMKGQSTCAHINLEKSERSELAELAAEIL